MCPDPKTRPSCGEALAHPWLNDRKNLEKRAFATRKRHDSSYLENPKWSNGQQMCFLICVIIIIASYSALITYLFNIDKPRAIFHDVKMECLETYKKVYESVDQCFDLIFDSFCKAVYYFCPFVL